MGEGSAMAVTRPSIEEIMLEVAWTWAKRSTCPRLSVGAVAYRDSRVIATGYNGAPSGLPHCTEIGCKLVGGHCFRALHAEENLIIQCAKIGVSIEGCSVITTHYPCYRCARALVQAGVKEIIYAYHYWNDEEVEELLRNANVALRAAKS